MFVDVEIKGHQKWLVDLFRFMEESNASLALFQTDQLDVVIQRETSIIITVGEKILSVTLLDNTRASSLLSEDLPQLLSFCKIGKMDCLSIP